MTTATKKVNKKVTAWQPTENMAKFVEVQLNADKPLNITNACSEANVDRASYYKWIKKPEFMDWYNLQREQVAKGWLGSVDASLRWRALKGDSQAIKLCYERFDNLKQRQEIEVKGEVELKVTLPDSLKKK